VLPKALFQVKIQQIGTNENENEKILTIWQQSLLKKESKIKCLTGDVGLHVGIGVRKSKDITVRCYRCNQNNEMASDKMHYHPLENIQETTVQSMGGTVMYFCTKCQHSSKLKDDETEYFINKPYLRYV
jgi:hypothetical protein